MNHAPKLQAVEGRPLQRVLESWTYGRFTVAEGFVTDGATIPRFLWTVIGGPFHPMFSAAAVMHDWLYRGESDHPDVTRKLADDVFYGLLKRNRVNPIRAWLMWFAVRSFGWMFYVGRE